MFSKVIGFGLEIDNNTISYAKFRNLAEANINFEDVSFVAKTVKDETKGTLKVEDKEIITFTSHVKKDNFKIDLSLIINEDDEEFILKLNTNLSKKSNTKISGTTNLNIEFTEDDETLKIDTKINNNIEINGKINELDTANAIDYNILSYKEQGKIDDNFEEVLEDSTLYYLLYYIEDFWYYYVEDWYYDDLDYDDDDDWYYDDEDWYYDDEDWYYDDDLDYSGTVSFNSAIDNEVDTTFNGTVVIDYIN